MAGVGGVGEGLFGGLAVVGGFAGGLAALFVLDDGDDVAVAGGGGGGAAGEGRGEDDGGEDGAGEDGGGEGAVAAAEAVLARVMGFLRWPAGFAVGRGRGARREGNLRGWVRFRGRERMFFFCSCQTGRAGVGLRSAAPRGGGAVLARMG